MPLCDTSGERCQRKDLHVLSRRAHAGKAFSVRDEFPFSIACLNEHNPEKSNVNQQHFIYFWKNIIRFLCFSLSLSPGDLRGRCVVHLQSTPTTGGAGGGGLYLPAAWPAYWDEGQEDAHQVEGDVRQVNGTPGPQSSWTVFGRNRLLNVALLCCSTIVMGNKASWSIEAFQPIVLKYCRFIIQGFTQYSVQWWQISHVV